MDERDGRQPRFYPPITPPAAAAISVRFASVDQRIKIADLCRAGGTMRSIGAELGRSPGTISRELRRNSDAGSGEYRPHGAQKMAQGRRPRPKQGKLEADPALRNDVQTFLEKRWSPEQISHLLPSRFPGQRERHVVHESIYQALYVQGRGELRRELAKLMLTDLTVHTAADLRAVAADTQRQATKDGRLGHPGLPAGKTSRINKLTDCRNDR